MGRDEGTTSTDPDCCGLVDQTSCAIGYIKVQTHVICHEFADGMHAYKYECKKCTDSADIEKFEEAERVKEASSGNMRGMGFYAVVGIGLTSMLGFGFAAFRHLSFRIRQSRIDAHGQSDEDDESTYSRFRVTSRLVTGAVE